MPLGGSPRCLVHSEEALQGSICMAQVQPQQCCRSLLVHAAVDMGQPAAEPHLQQLAAGLSAPPHRADQGVMPLLGRPARLWSAAGLLSPAAVRCQASDVRWLLTEQRGHRAALHADTVRLRAGANASQLAGERRCARLANDARHQLGPVWGHRHPQGGLVQAKRALLALYSVVAGQRQTAPSCWTGPPASRRTVSSCRGIASQPDKLTACRHQ